MAMHLGSSFLCHPGDSADDHIDLCEVITLADEAICLAYRMGACRDNAAWIVAKEFCAFS